MGEKMLKKAGAIINIQKIESKTNIKNYQNYQKTTICIFYQLTVDRSVVN